MSGRRARLATATAKTAPPSMPPAERTCARLAQPKEPATDRRLAARRAPATRSTRARSPRARRRRATTASTSPSRCRALAWAAISLAGTSEAEVAPPQSRAATRSPGAGALRELDAGSGRRGDGARRAATAMRTSSTARRPGSPGRRHRRLRRQPRRAPAQPGDPGRERRARRQRLCIVDADARLRDRRAHRRHRRIRRARLRFTSCRIGAHRSASARGRGLQGGDANARRASHPVAAAAQACALRLRRRMTRDVAQDVRRRPATSSSQAKLAQMALTIDERRSSSSPTAPPGCATRARTSRARRDVACRDRRRAGDRRGVQMCGRGVQSGGETVEKLYREIRALRIYEGASEVQKLIIGHDLLGSMAQNKDSHEERRLSLEGWSRAWKGYVNGVAASGRQIHVAGPGRLDARDGVRERRLRDPRARRSKTSSPCCAGGAKPEHIVRMTWYVTSKRVLASGREVGSPFLGDHRRLRHLRRRRSRWTALMEDRAKVEIEVTAVVFG